MGAESGRTGGFEARSFPQHLCQALLGTRQGTPPLPPPSWLVTGPGSGMENVCICRVAGSPCLGAHSVAGGGWPEEEEVGRATCSLGGCVFCAPGRTGPSAGPLRFLLQILRHFEASCRQRPPAQRPPVELGPAAGRGGPADLLTDAVPFSGSHAFLQPLSSALFPPQGPAHPLPPDGSPLSVPREAEAGPVGSREEGAGPEWSPPGTGSPKGAPELCPGPGGCSSLFAGMELVACPRLLGAGPATEEAPQAPWTPPQRAAAAGAPPGSEPSAFPFLNS